MVNGVNIGSMLITFFVVEGSVFNFLFSALVIEEVLKHGKGDGCAGGIRRVV